MLFIAFIAVLLAAIMGFGVVYFLRLHPMKDYYNENYRIGGGEYVAVLAIMALLITPSVLVVGKKLSVDNIVTYYQFLNGAEKRPIDEVTKCYGGHYGDDESAGQSNCDYTYVSGSYTYTEWVEESYSCTGSDGKPDTCYHLVPKTRYANIYTPYATVEHRYAIPSSFGFMENKTHYFSRTYLDEKPKKYGKKSIPGDLPKGPPADWVDAKEHFDAGDPRPVTALAKYDNYILAGDDETLKSYSAHIARYKKAGLLPDHTANIMSDPIGGPSHTQAKKLSFVGVHVADEQAWQDAVMRFNAALGMKLQGDLHVVIVDSAKVPSSDAVLYANALKAYWQGDAFGKRALAKNAVVVAMGVSDNSTIEWAEATTGMPFGNQQMAQYIRDKLPGTDFTPEAIFGSPRTVITGKKAKVTLSSPRGVLEQIVFETAPFARASMSCEDKDESCVGFKDLLDTIEPTKTQKFVMLLVTSFFATGLWVFVAFTTFIDDLFAGLRSTYSGYRRPNETEYDLLYDRRRGKKRRNNREEWWL